MAGFKDGKIIADYAVNQLISSAATDPGEFTTVDPDSFQDALSGLAVSAATVATGDKLLIQDVDDSDNLKYVTVQSIVDLGGLSWTEVTGTSQAAVVSSGYITNNAGAVTVTLPGTCAIGDVVAIVGKGAGGWILKPASGDTIEMLGTTTAGSETVTPTEVTATMEVVCITANAAWAVKSSTGNFTFA